MLAAPPLTLAPPSHGLTKRATAATEKARTVMGNEAGWSEWKGWARTAGAGWEWWVEGAVAATRLS